MEQLKQGLDTPFAPRLSPKTSERDLVLDLESVPLVPSSNPPKRDPHGFCVEWQIEPVKR